MTVTQASILGMSGAELDDLFRRGEVGDIPDGEADGTAIIAPGTPLEAPLAKFVHWFAWQGKRFDAKSGTLRNRILPLGLQAIAADVYREQSWFDSKECIVLDYSKSSRIAQHIRDEIRCVGPGLYLGLVFWDRTKLIDFTLQFPVASSEPAKVRA
jgi:hypothetical protein